MAPYSPHTKLAIFQIPITLLKNLVWHGCLRVVACGSGASILLYYFFFGYFTEVGITCIPRLPRLSWFRTKKYSMACFEGMWGIETQIHIPQRAWCMKVVKNWPWGHYRAVENRTLRSNTFPTKQCLGYIDSLPEAFLGRNTCFWGPDESFGSKSLWKLWL